MKNMIFLVAAVTMLASACVGQDDAQDTGDGALAQRAVDAPNQADLHGTDRVQDHDEPMIMPESAPAEPDQQEPEEAYEPGEGLVNYYDETRTSSRCGVPALSVLHSARAFRLSKTFIDVEIHGQIHADIQSPGSFSFAVLTEEGNDISGRSWPEVESVDIREDGTFTMHVRAAGCGDYDPGRRISVRLYGNSDLVEGRAWSNTLEMDIEEPVRLTAGETCEDFGTACGQELFCNNDQVCEAF